MELRRPRKGAVAEKQEISMADTLDTSKLTDRVAALVDAARKAGADAADAVVVLGRSTSVSVRLGKVENTNASDSFSKPPAV